MLGACSEDLDKVKRLGINDCIAENCENIDRHNQAFMTAYEISRDAMLSLRTGQFPDGAKASRSDRQFGLLTAQRKLSVLHGHKLDRVELDDDIVHPYERYSPMAVSAWLKEHK